MSDDAMGIASIQIWTVDKFPWNKLHFGGSFLLEGVEYIISQEEIERIRNLPDAAEIVARADKIREMIMRGEIKMKGRLNEND